MNKVIITGFVASDPEAYTTKSGIARSQFRVAVQRRFANANGERVSDFLTVVAWRGTAEYCNKYLLKGRRVSVEGSIQNRSYDAQDGSKRYVTEIIADNVEILERIHGDRAEDHEPQHYPASNDDFTEVDPGDELPF